MLLVRFTVCTAYMLCCAASTCWGAMYASINNWYRGRLLSCVGSTTVTNHPLVRTPTVDCWQHCCPRSPHCGTFYGLVRLRRNVPQCPKSCVTRLSADTQRRRHHLRRGASYVCDTSRTTPYLRSDLYGAVVAARSRILCDVWLTLRQDAPRSPYF